MYRYYILFCVLCFCSHHLLPNSSAGEEVNGLQQKEVTAESGDKITPELLKKYEHLFAAVEVEDINKSIKRGVDFLIAEQNENGSFGSAKYFSLILLVPLYSPLNSVLA